MNLWQFRAAHSHLGTGSVASHNSITHPGEEGSPLQELHFGRQRGSEGGSDSRGTPLPTGNSMGAGSRGQGHPHTGQDLFLLSVTTSLILGSSLALGLAKLGALQALNRGTFSLTAPGSFQHGFRLILEKHNQLFSSAYCVPGTLLHTVARGPAVSAPHGKCKLSGPITGLRGCM